MRTLGVGNSAQPTSTLRDFTDAVKIEVANASDVLTNLTANAASVEYESTSDEIVDAATVVFRWQAGASSYAPLMTASPPIAVGRRIVVSINPGSGTYKEVFRGKIDEVDWPERFGDVTVKCRDQAGVAADTWVENKIPYSTTAGAVLDTVMQEVADDNLDTSYTLNFPVATSAVVQHVAGEDPYGPQDQSVLDALRALAESIGWTIRWRHFDASASDWKWTVFNPSRTKTTPDHTFAAADYWNVTQMGQSIEDIRNVVEVEFTQSGGSRGKVVVTDSVSTGGAMTAASATLTVTGGNTFAATDVGKTIKVPGAGAAGATLTTTIATYVSATQVTLTVAASTTVTGKEVLWGSIADYGRRYMKISEADDSPINRLALATSLANAALSDLKDPDALLEIECRYFWPGEVGVDLYRFSANNKHFSSNQDLAAMSFRHRIAVGERPTTWILTRGKPSGGVLMWKRRIGNTLPTTTTPDIAVTNFREVARGQASVTLGWDVSGDIDEIWVWYSTPSQPLASDPWASFVGIPTVRLTADSTSYAIAIPDYGSVTYVQIVPIGVRENIVVRGNPARFTIQGEQVKLHQRITQTAQTATTITVVVAVANPIASGDVTITHVAQGCTVDLTSPQTIASASVTSDITTTGTKTYVITRATTNGRVTFTASATDRITDVDAVDVPALDSIGQGSIAISSGGVPTLQVDGPLWAVSHKYAESTAEFPSEATVLSSGTTNNNRQFAATLSSTLSIGGDVYVTVIPFSVTGAAGVQGTSFRLKATRHDFSATKTQSLSVSNFVAILPNTNINRHDYNNGYLRNINWPAANIFVFFSQTLVIPDGVTITGISAELYYASGSDASINMNLLRVSSTGGETSIANATTSTTGWQTCTASCSESTTGRKYRIQAQLQNVALVPTAPADGDVRASTVSYTYTMPSSTNAI